MVTAARSGASLPLSPLLEACLAAFDGGATRAAARRSLTDWPSEAIASLLDVLVEIGFLVPARPRPADGWTTWAPVADWFHFSTRDVPVVPRRTPRPPPPPAVTRRPTTASVRLPWPSIDGDLRTTLCERRTWRRLSRRPLTLEHLGSLLGATFGIQSWAEAPSAGWSALKTSPSGGARHSLEAYVCVRHVTGVRAGLYHYRPDVHRLDLVRPHCSSADLTRFLPGQDGYHRAPVVCMMASTLDRVRWRYAHARAYRIVLMEAGHLAQTFALVATALGLASFSTGALADTAIEDAFLLSPVSTPVMYAVGAGVRPAGIDWAPYAKAAPPRRRVTPLGRRMRQEPAA